MKKSLLFVLTMVTGIFTKASANPFTDVPAGHWAYDSIAKLANAGIVDGYSSTFGGEKLMTRYEMAQIVAKAMAKGANCDKLTAEFADELDTLGVRVAKLENKFDNVKITGNIRYSYRDTKGGYTAYNATTKNGHARSYNRFRTRLWFNGQINDDWQYTGMLENNRYLDTNHTRADALTLRRAWVTGRIGGLKVEAGRCYFVQISMFDGEGDGIKASYNFNGLNITGWAMKNPLVLHHGSNIDTDLLRDEDRLYMIKAEKSFGELDAHLAYWNSDCHLGTKILDVCMVYPIIKNLKLTGEYYYGNGDLITGKKSDKNGFEVKLKYGLAKASIPGSWSIYALYFNKPFSCLMSPSTLCGYAVEPYHTDITGEGDGLKGWEGAINYVVAKNITLGLRYFDNVARKHTNGHARTIWSEVVFIF